MNDLSVYVSKCIGILFRVSSFLPTTIMMRIFNSMINSKLSYMITSYGTANKTTIDRLFVLQKRALKVIFRLPIDFSSFRLFTTKTVGTLPLRLMFERSIALITYQMLNNLTLHSLELQRLPTTQQTRRAVQGRLIPRKARTTKFGQSCFEFLAPQIFNNIPHQITIAPSLTIFKRQFTNFLLSNENIIRSL